MGRGRLAFFAGVHQPSAGSATLGAAIVAVILLNGVFSFVQEQRAIEALARLLPLTAKVIRDGLLAELPTAVLVPGNVIKLTRATTSLTDRKINPALFSRRRSQSAWAVR